MPATAEQFLGTSRLASLMKRIEDGETITPRDVRTIETMQALDIVRSDELYALESIQRNREQDETHS